MGQTSPQEGSKWVSSGVPWDTAMGSPEAGRKAEPTLPEGALES